ncbi:hypothetical protein VWZ88_13730 [Phaeobacter sp. JH20_36]|uniref:hypothetical protein n=1 Tax=unclassified Phaeobacter TaxID=2621772 RepID=UPI003A844436
MILAVLLPIAMPIVALICLFAAYRPNRISRALLAATGWALLAMTGWYVARFILGLA